MKELDDQGNRIAELELLVARQERAIEIYAMEKAHARACYERAVRVLTGIHALLYPPTTTTPDGKTWVFRPKGLDPHQVLQALSDRIRALPDEIAEADAEMTRKVAKPCPPPTLTTGRITDMEKEEWIKRCAARYMKYSELSEATAIKCASFQYEEAGDDFPADPEGAADADMESWDDDGHDA